MAFMPPKDLPLEQKHDVIPVVRALIYFDSGKGRKRIPRRMFTKELKEWIKEFQAKHGLSERDGQLGPETWERLLTRIVPPAR